MRILLVLLKIVAVSTPLTWLWLVWGREAYGKLFLQLAMPIYGMFGLTTVVPDGARDRFINYLPFLILMLVTPRLTPTRRLVGSLAGFLIIFAAHVAFVYVADLEAARGAAMTHSRFVRIVPANTLSDSLPFVLWVVIARDFVWESVGGLFRAPEAESGTTEVNSGTPEP